MATADEKKPLKGILKNSTSFDKAEAHEQNKEMKWDEMNILATHHPPDKDYGHMKIDEPKTPYSYENDGEDAGKSIEADQESLDPVALSKKLEGAHPRILHATVSESSEDEDEDEEETEEQKAIRKVFEQKRKLHYNEFHAVKLAKQLMDEEEVEEEGEEEENTEGKVTEETKMEDLVKDNKQEPNSEK